MRLVLVRASIILFNPLIPLNVSFLKSCKRPLHIDTKLFIPSLTRGIIFPVEKKEAADTTRSPIIETPPFIAEQTFAFRVTNTGYFKNSIAI